MELALFASNDCGPLMGLKRYDEARALLFACRDVFERENSVEGLGKVFLALADLEHDLGHAMTAQQFGETGVRYVYTRGDPADAVAAHYNIGEYIKSSEGERSEALAHRLAAALISVATGLGEVAGYLAALASNLRGSGPEGRAALPADFAALCATVEKIEGVRFREMIERLTGGPAECDQLFRQVVSAALEAANKPE